MKMKWKRKKKITLYRKNKIHRYSFHISKYFLTWKEHSFLILRSISKRQLISSSFSLTAILHSNANENKNARKKFAKIQFSDIHFSPPPPFSSSFLKKEERKKKSITIFHSINLTNTQSLLNTIILLIIHDSNEIMTRRFVQIAWLKSPAQLFGDLKEILVQRDVDVDYRDEPIIFFSAQIPQFAIAFAQPAADSTPHQFHYQFIVTWNPNSLTRSLLAISYRYDTDIIRILILVFDTALVCVCIHVSYKLSVKTRTCWHIKFDCIRYELKYGGKASWLIG